MRVPTCSTSGQVAGVQRPTAPTHRPRASRRRDARRRLGVTDRGWLRQATNQLSGQLTGLPLGGQAAGMIWYNKNIFDEAGATVPTTYDEWLATSRLPHRRCSCCTKSCPRLGHRAEARSAGRSSWLVAWRSHPRSVTPNRRRASLQREERGRSCRGRRSPGPPPPAPRSSTSGPSPESRAGPIALRKSTFSKFL